MLEPKVQKRVLIVWVYFPAVGHFVEAIEVAANFRGAYPDFKIDILVNEETVFGLGEFCDWIDTVYAFNVPSLSLNGDDDKTLGDLEFLYDYVIFPKRLQYTPNDYPKEMLESNLFLQNHFKPKLWGGYNGYEGNDNLAIKELLYSEFQMTLPASALAYASNKITGHPVFSIVLKGASRESIWPSLSTWKHILLEIKETYPNAIFLITGLLKMHVKPGQSNEKAEKLLNKFIDSIPGAINCYDVALYKQLALIQTSDVFISPHSGFAFLAPCVGTPWLALSGTRWSEPMIAHRPFYYVLPSCKNYPCSNDMKLECKFRLKLKAPVKCMVDISKRTEEILFGIQKLLDKSYTFEESFEQYDLEATHKKVNIKKLWRIKEYKKHLKMES